MPNKIPKSAKIMPNYERGKKKADISISFGLSEKRAVELEKLSIKTIKSFAEKAAKKEMSDNGGIVLDSSSILRELYKSVKTWQEALFITHGATRTLTEASMKSERLAGLEDDVEGLIEETLGNIHSIKVESHWENSSLDDSEALENLLSHLQDTHKFKRFDFANKDNIDKHGTEEMQHIFHSTMEVREAITSKKTPKHEVLLAELFGYEVKK